jgi:hypothetical protein
MCWARPPLRPVPGGCGPGTTLSGRPWRAHACTDLRVIEEDVGGMARRGETRSGFWAGVKDEGNSGDWMDVKNRGLMTKFDSLISAEARGK